MVEARVMRLPGYKPAPSPDTDDAASEGDGEGFIQRLGRLFFEDDSLDFLALVDDDDVIGDDMSTLPRSAPATPRGGVQRRVVRRPRQHLLMLLAGAA